MVGWTVGSQWYYVLERLNDAVTACKLISHDREKLALNFELQSLGDETFNYRPLTLKSAAKYPLRHTTVSLQFMVNLLNLLVSWSDKIFTLWIPFSSISFNLFSSIFSLCSIYLFSNISSILTVHHLKEHNFRVALTIQ